MKMLRLLHITMAALLIACAASAGSAAATAPVHPSGIDMCWFFYAPETGLTTSTEPIFAELRDLQGSYLGPDRDLNFGEHEVGAAHAFVRLHRTHGRLRKAVLFSRDGARVVVLGARVWSSEPPARAGVQSVHLIAPKILQLPADLYAELPAASRALSEVRIEQIVRDARDDCRDPARRGSTGSP